MGNGVAFEPAPPCVVDSPVMVTVEAVVLCGVSLDTGLPTLRTGTACMEPFSVGVYGVLDSIFICCETVFRRKCAADIVPSFAFDLYEVNVSFELFVAKHCVSYLVK